MLVKYTVAALASFLVASSVSANKKSCEKACTMEYSPICARSKTGKLKEFGNTCIFEIALCSEPYLDWQLVIKGPCDDLKKKCEKACTKEYNPICARSNTGELKEFGNPCIYDIAVCSEPYLGWQAISNGPCEDLKKCEKACTDDYNPICARSKTGELKEFGNPCTYDIAVCSEPYLGWQEINKGPCDYVKPTGTGTPN
ncbi:hypothetical protein BGZ93_009260 [Podila epicladia]|nr:hypothetical protein BGZ92_002351 [Podila epicladia]KAG0099066.1 hypothetical protein BGZ93_009260 [Podila epicladia]